MILNMRLEWGRRFIIYDPQTFDPIMPTISCTFAVTAMILVFNFSDQILRFLSPLWIQPHIVEVFELKLVFQA